MSDPYQILGVPRSASDDDIKKAYKNLSRKYHPDANINNPNKELAEEKFKQVSQAYNQIMEERKHGYTGSSYGGYGNSGAGGYSRGYGSSGGYGSYGDFGGFGGFGGFGSFDGFGRDYGSANTGNTEDDMHLNAAYNYINSRHYAEALNVLNSISNRTAIWYYYSALANKGLGNNVQALEHARMAASMEPNNQRYRQLVNTLEGGGQWYSSRQQDFGGMPVIMCSNPLLTCCLLNSICNLCGNACCWGYR